MYQLTADDHRVIALLTDNYVDADPRKRARLAGITDSKLDGDRAKLRRLEREVASVERSIALGEAIQDMQRAVSTGRVSA